jgi:pyruvate dehydrogenase E1 component
VAGAYPLRRSSGAPAVTIAVMGAVVPEALAAAERLAEIGTPADVVCVTSPGLLFRALRARQGFPGPASSGPSSPAGPHSGEPWILEQAFPAARATPLVTVLDGHPHTLSFLATVSQVPHIALGVAQFGQSGSIEDLYRYNGIDTDSIIRAALDLVP